MTHTPAAVKGFWYYTGLILGACFACVAVIAATAVLGLLAHALTRVFLYGWRVF